MLKVKLKYTLSGHHRNIFQPPWQSVGCGSSYIGGNFLKYEITSVHPKPRSWPFVLKGTSKYTLSRPPWNIFQLPRDSVGCVPSYIVWNFIKHKITSAHPKLRSWTFALKVTSKYILSAHHWIIFQLPWHSVGCVPSYIAWNFLKHEITPSSRSWDPGRFCSKWHWNIYYLRTTEAYSNSLGIRLAVSRETLGGTSSNTKLHVRIRSWDPGRLCSK
jgi:hypothetical protein